MEAWQSRLNHNLRCCGSIRVVHRLWVYLWRYKSGLVQQLDNMSASPLKTLPDRFDAATHRELDSVVQKSVNNDLGDVSDVNSGLQHSVLLIAIIENSNGDLDPTYLSFPRAKKLINTHGELREMLDSAWKNKSYREIRNLGTYVSLIPVQQVVDELSTSYP